jgi:flavin reductase (DIM6/NTAB) family NADH-FMN oxidoreductase RutF
MKKESLPATSKNYRLINYGPVVMVSSGDDKRRNIASIAWSTPVSSEPLLVGVAISKDHFSTKLIIDTREFVINVPSADLVKKVQDCGSVHGNEADKFDTFGLTPLKANKVKTPLIKECYAHLECKVIQAPPTGDHVLFIGEVVSASINEGLLTPGGTVDVDKVKTLHHLGGKEFATLTKIKN